MNELWNDGNEPGGVLHSCHPRTQSLSGAGGSEFKASLGYMVRIVSGIEKKKGKGRTKYTAMDSNM